MELTKMTLNDYLGLLGSDAPAPGGGSASALAGAQGAQLTAMVAALTLGKKKYEDKQQLCEQVREQALELAECLREQIDNDTAAFNLVSAAYKLPKDSDEQKAVRSKAIADASLKATEVPLATMGLALDALRATESLVGNSNQNAASDLGVAALNLNACVMGAWLNVLINLPSLENPETAFTLKADGRSIAREADIIARGIYERVADSL